MRTADTSDCPATCPPKVRCRKPDSGLNTLPPVDVDLELLQVEDFLDRHRPVPRAPAYQPALGQAMGLRDVLHVDADHRLAQPARHLGQHIGIVVEGGGLHDRRRAGGRVTGLEDARTDEHTLGTELHHHRRIRRGGDTPAVNSVTGNLPARAASATSS